LEVLLLLITLLIAGWAGCQSRPVERRGPGETIPVMVPEAARAAGFSVQQSDQAVRLYTAKCMRCHRSYDPTAYSNAEWETWMTKMSRKARLAAQERQLLWDYLLAFRASTPLKRERAR
jgi:hypothetical protein